MRIMEIDFHDKAILEEIQRDSAVSINDLAERVGLSTTPCWRRVKRLEEAGVITDRVALLDPLALNLRLTAFISVKTAAHSETWIKTFAAKIELIDEIVEVHRMSGEVDYLLKVVCPDMAAFDRIYKRLIAMIEFADVSTTFSMESMKSTTRLPLDYL